MRLNRLVVAAFSAITMCSTAIAAPDKAASTGDEATCRNFVQSFYKWYLTDPRSDRAYEKRANDFSPNLLKQLKDDLAASKKSKDEVVGLDFDPFLDTNAEPFAKYTATKVTKKNNSYLVQVDGSGGGRTDHTRILPEVECKAGKCQFVNFHYTEAKPPDDNLLGVLKSLRENRSK